MLPLGLIKMAFQDLMERASALIDAAKVFNGVIGMNIDTDYLTGKRRIRIVAETVLNETTKLSEEITVVIEESGLTEAKLDKHIADTLTKFDTRVG